MLTLIDALWRRTLDLARDLTDRHSSALGTRTLDVLHVATAVTLGHRAFVTYDDRQAALARKIGLRCVAPYKGMPACARAHSRSARAGAGHPETAAGFCTGGLGCVRYSAVAADAVEVRAAAP
jgi:hypothetical protein